MPNEEQPQSARLKISSNKLLAAIREWAGIAIGALPLIILVMHSLGLFFAAPNDATNVKAKAKLEFLQLISARGLSADQTAKLYRPAFS